MMLSSTINTLIGGTVPSINPPKTAPGDTDAFGFRKDLGEAIGAGGVWELTFGDSTADAGDVGIFWGDDEGGG